VLKNYQNQPEAPKSTINSNNWALLRKHVFIGKHFRMILPDILKILGENKLKAHQNA